MLATTSDEMLFSTPEPGQFSISVEVVPPAGVNAEPLLTALESIRCLPFDRYSVATNPVAKPRMSALAFSSLVQQRTAKQVTLHCTTRDHNRLSLQGLLWGARALGITSVLAATGDYVALSSRGRITSVQDLDIYGLIAMAREAELVTGVVLDPRPESSGLAHQVRRLEQKVEAGAQYVVTQPVYDEQEALTLRQATRHLGIPVVLGILPLRSARHARFLDQKVAGIAVPVHVQERMARATEPLHEGAQAAREMLDIARSWFSGACIMPPFDDYDLLHRILE